MFKRHIFWPSVCILLALIGARTAFPASIWITNRPATSALTLSNVVNVVNTNFAALDAALSTNSAAGKLNRASDNATNITFYGTNLVTARGSTTARGLEDRFAETVNVKDYGAVGDGTTDDTAAIQAAINAAGASGSTYFPKPDSFYRITTPLVVTNEAMRFFGEGYSSEIRQQTWGQPAFDLLNKDNCVFENLYIANSGTRTNIASTTYRGHNLSSYCAGIWISGNSNIVRNVKSSGFVAAVFLTGYNEDGAEGLTVRAVGNKVIGLEVLSVDFGVLAAIQNEMLIERVTGTVSASQADPIHLIYLAPSGDGFTGVTIRDSRCYGGAVKAFSIKEATHSTFENLSSYNCQGVLLLTDCSDNSFANITANSDICTAGSYAMQLDLGTTGNHRNTFDGVNIQTDSASTGFGVSIDGTNNVVRNAYVRSGNSGADIYLVRINGGYRNQIENLFIDASNSAGSSIGIGVVGGTDHSVSGFKTRKVKNALLSGASQTGLAISYEPDLQKEISAARMVQLGTTSGATVARGHGVQTFEVSASSSVQIDASRTTHARVNINDAGGFVILSPVESMAGSVLAIELVNLSGGVSGGITWGADFDMTGNTLRLQASERKLLHFVYGTNWVAASPGVTGILLKDGSAIFPSLALSSDEDATGTGLFRSAADSIGFTANGTERVTISPTVLNLRSQHILSWNSDTMLVRDGGAGALGLQNGASAQTFRIYGTYTDSSNYERLNARYNPATSRMSIMAESLGTGSPRTLAFGSGTEQWGITSSGHLFALADSSYDIGASGGNRPRNVYISGSIFGTGSSLSIDASGFNGNLATTDDTIQEALQKLDDLTASGGTGGTMINSGTPQQYALPMYNDTTGTNMVPTGLKSDASGTNFYAGALHINDLVVSNSFTAPSITVDTEVYGAGWDADLTVPTKDAVYDKIETLVAASGDEVLINGAAITNPNFKDGTNSVIWAVGDSTNVFGFPTNILSSQILDGTIDQADIAADAFTSAQLAAKVSDESGSGVLLFQSGNGLSLTASTPSVGDNGVRVATTAWVQTELDATKAGSHASPDATNPSAPTWNGPLHVFYAGGTMEIDLPAAAGYDGRAILIYNTGAFTITIDPNGTEAIVREGTLQTGGVSMTLASGAGNYVALICDGTRWITLGKQGALSVGT